MSEKMLDDVLNDYMASVEQPTRASLMDWIKKYPQFEKELTEFVASWALMEKLPSSEDNIDEDKLRLRGSSIIQNLMHKYGSDSKDSESKLFHGISAQEFVKQTGLSPVIFAKLQRRLIRLESIPQLAIERISKTIKREASEIVAFLKQPPVLAAGHRSERPPALSQGESFFDAIRNDRTMREEQRQFWLSLESNQQP
jgi:hypothetical protein